MTEKPARGPAYRPWSYAFRVGTYDFSLCGQGAELEELAASLFRGARAPATREGDRFALGRGPGGYTLRGAGGDLCAAADLPGAFRAIEWALTEACLARLDAYLQFHAGAVVCRGRAWLLPGPPEAGKTSLTLALYAAGAAVLTDEVALIDPRTLAAVPFPRDLLVRHGTARALAGALPPPASPWQRAAEHAYLSPADLRPSPPAEAPAVRLVFPRLAPDRCPRWRHVGPAEAARRLLDQALNGQHWSAAHIDALARLVARCPATEVTFSDSRATARALLARG